MEVLSSSTEKYDQTEKMQLYCEQAIEKYWIVDWRKKIWLILLKRQICKTS